MSPGARDPEPRRRGRAGGAAGHEASSGAASAREGPAPLALCVTGTNGKTSTTGMLASIAAAAGDTPLCVTTLGARLGGEELPYDGSMPSFRSALSAAAAAGARHACVEVTSRALAGGFADRFAPDVAVLTSFSRDHLDRHGTLEAYLAAKARLFLALRPGGVAVLNACAPASALIAHVLPAGVDVRTFAVRVPAPDAPPASRSLRAGRVECRRDGTRVELEDSPLAAALGSAFHLRQCGSVFAEDALAAAVAADAAGASAEAIRRGLEAYAGAPGRFEVVAERPLVVVDFAHTPDALARTLETARALVREEAGRVHLVFGCGGDRDRGKRAPMGALADALADRVFSTADNPRSEPPERIAAEVAAGAAGRALWTTELDRAAAIEAALRAAGPRDAVVVAGRGHEGSQELATGPRPFDDATVAREACGRLGLAVRARPAATPEPPSSRPAGGPRLDAATGRGGSSAAPGRSPEEDST